MEVLQQQEQKQAAVQEHATTVQHALEEGKLKELYAKAANLIASARERHGRNESNIGLFEERLSEVAENNALATKAKMEALDKLMDAIAKHGEIEASLKMNDLESIHNQGVGEEERAKMDAKRTSMGNDFVREMMGQLNALPQQQEQQQMQPQGGMQ